MAAPKTCIECGVELHNDSHRFYDPDLAGREQFVGQYCDDHCPRCFRTPAEATS